MGNSDVFLYAKWTAKNYSLSYDGNGDPYAEERSFRLILPTIGVRAEL